MARKVLWSQVQPPQQFLESSITAQGVQARFYAAELQAAAVFLVGSLEPIHCSLLLTKPDIDETYVVCGDVPLPG
jgi:hypothetical protein